MSGVHVKSIETSVLRCVEAYTLWLWVSQVIGKLAE